MIILLNTKVKHKDGKLGYGNDGDICGTIALTVAHS